MLCKFCRYDIPAEDIELSHRLAKCRGCNRVFAIELAASPVMATTSATIPSKPDKLKLIDEHGQGYMQWHWFHPVAFVLLIFCIAWNSFLFTWYSHALFGLGGANAARAPFEWLMIIFPIGHVAVGVGLAYLTLCLFFNRTQIVYDGRYLVSRSGPIPVRRTRTFAREEILRLENEARASTTKSHTQYLWQLYVIQTDNTRKPLITQVHEPALIRYVQWQLETWLDLPVGRSST